MKLKKIGKNARIRVLVVDDSVVIRRLVGHALEHNPSFEVVGNAANGAIALRMIPLTKPDVVTLDVEMPEMDGLQTLREIRRLYPELIVIMFSTLTERCAATTIQALTLGANDYVAKVANIGSLDRSMARLKEELVPKLEQFFIRESEGSKAAKSPVALQVPAAKKEFAGAPFQSSFRKPGSYRAVVVGVSTGGPQALAQVVPMVPDSFPLPILIVQHMPALFTRLLADRLQQLTKLRVQEGQEGTTVERGNIYIAPGNFHMRVARKEGKEVLALNQEEPENSCRPAVDVLFRSAAEVYKGAVIAVVLTGMGQDGKRGVETLRQQGSYVIAQDQNSSVVWGMPGAVVQAGLAHSVVDLHCVAPEIAKHV